VFVEHIIPLDIRSPILVAFFIAFVVVRILFIGGPLSFLQFLVVWVCYCKWRHLSWFFDFYV